MAARKTMAMGAFVLGGVLLFAVGLFLIGDRRMLFSGSGNYYTDYDGISGLEVGDKVRVAGLDAGEILDLRIPSGPGVKFRVKFRVIDKLFPVIRTDSIASIQTDGLLGNKYLLINIGTKEQAPLESVLPSREPFEMGDLMARIGETVKSLDETVGEVKGDVADAFSTVSATATHVNEIVTSSQTDIRTMTGAASKITGDASLIMSRLSAGEGTVGKLLKDDAVYNNMKSASMRSDEILADLRQTSKHVNELVVQFQSGKVPENIEATLANVRDSTERLKVMISALQPGLSSSEGLSADLRATIANSREATSDLADNMEALKHGFFFRGFFNDRGYFDLSTITLADYQSKEFDKKAHKEREWVQPKGLFTVKANGSEELSDMGRASIDLAMDDFHRFTEGIALMVEGYSAIGTQNERFIRSRNRSLLVRDYLEKKFTLNSGYVGVMAMGSVQSHTTPLTFEDGVALVLLRK
jgi:phospholipid/cholesterol/gamma-HCH transport system substrate-binding protein